MSALTTLRLIGSPTKPGWPYILPCAVCGPFCADELCCCCAAPLLVRGGNLVRRRHVARRLLGAQFEHQRVAFHARAFEDGRAQSHLHAGDRDVVLLHGQLHRDAGDERRRDLIRGRELRGVNAGQFDDEQVRVGAPDGVGHRRGARDGDERRGPVGRGAHGLGHGPALGLRVARAAAGVRPRAEREHEREDERAPHRGCFQWVSVSHFIILLRHRPPAAATR